MIKKTINTEDFEGNPLTEEHYFHMREADYLKFEAKYSRYGGMAAYVTSLQRREDAAGIVEFYEDLILQTYGEKSMDGKSHLKSPDIVEKFKWSSAFSALLIELIGNAQEANEFFIGTLTPKQQMQVRAELAKQKSPVVLAEPLPGLDNVVSMPVSEDGTV